MTDQHPITPPPELVQQLCDKAILHAVDGAKRGEIEVWLIQEAFRAGADDELEACCGWLVLNGYGDAARRLRAARRPKPPSLKQQALALIDECTDPEGDYLGDNALSIIRRALEQLDD
jgi:hypothetical protein